jgi:hypothetical protein
MSGAVAGLVVRVIGDSQIMGMLSTLHARGQAAPRL